MRYLQLQLSCKSSSFNPSRATHGLSGGERASLGSEARLWKHEVSCKAKKVPLADAQPVRWEEGTITQVAKQGRRVRLGVDPDNTGAVAIISCSGLSEDGGSLQDATVEVHDMPIEEHPAGKRMRRQTNCKAVSQLLQSVLAERGADQVHVTLEEPTPNAMNGKHSWFGAGFAFGAWNGLLAAQGIPMTSVPCRRWKTDLQLTAKGKAGSRQLALDLFPHAQPLLKRQKDHGRAEAMLIAAWGLGLRIAKPPKLPALPAELDTDEEPSDLFDEYESEPLDEPVSAEEPALSSGMLNSATLEGMPIWRTEDTERIMASLSSQRRGYMDELMQQAAQEREVMQEVMQQLVHSNVEPAADPEAASPVKRKRGRPSKAAAAAA